MENVKTVFCNNCQNKTDHSILFVKNYDGSECINEEDPFEQRYYIRWSDTYSMLECNGCHEVHLEKTYYFSEADGVELQVYPPRIARKTPKWITSVPDNQAKLLREIYKALAADCPQLVTMGTRTLIDLFIVDKIGDIGTFDTKMRELESKGFISKIQNEYLSAALETGHAVIHRGFRPNDNVVGKVLDIIENLLINYSLEEVSEELKSVTPKKR
jgi:hypothetical protein